MMLERFTAACLVAVLMGCSRGAPPSHDSAPQQGGEPFALGSEPALELGESEGSEVVFGRVSDVTFRDDGGLLVSDAVGPRVWQFASDGSRLPDLGRAGQGPGEFQDAASLFRMKDGNVALYDSRLRRLSIFASDGAFVASGSLPQDSYRMLVSAVGLLEDGTLITSTQAMGSAGPPGVFRDTVEIDALEVRRRGASVTFPRSTKVGEVLNTEQYRPGGPPRAFGIPYAASYAVAVGAKRVFIGDGANWTFTVRTAPGWGVPDTVQLDEPLRSVTPEEYEAAKKRMVGASLPRGADPEHPPAQVVRFWDPIFKAIPFPEHEPAYRSFLVDDRGRLWIQRWKMDRGGKNAWVVLSPDLVELETLDVPDAFVPFDVRGDRVAGVMKGVYDQDIVQVYRLHPRGGWDSTGAGPR